MPLPYPNRTGFVIAMSLCLLALPHAQAGLRISELLAGNDGGLRDADRDTPDWVELYNDADTPVALAGWHLTDSASFLGRWTFPTTNLAARGHLIVFASGKDRAVAGAELHTNFRLTGSGGYLALVQPDGVTIAHARAYPAQRANVSFGTGQHTTTNTLLSASAACRYFVPTNASLGTNWTLAGFSDAGWTTATNGLGYDSGTNTNGTVVLAFDVNERGSSPVTQPGFVSFVINSNISSTAIQTNPTTRTFSGISVTLSNTAPHGYDDRVRGTPTNSGAFTLSALLRDHVMSRELSSTGGLDWVFSGLQPDQSFQVSVWSYDTGSANPRISDWYANGLLVKDNYTFNGSVLPTTDDQFRFDFYTTSTASGMLTVQGRRDLSSLANNPAVQVNGMRLTQLGYAGSVASNVEGAMKGRNASLYVRYPFTVTNPAGVMETTLRVQYDDGFVAYLNGQVIASRNAPVTPVWNSPATAAHSGATTESIPVALPPGLLLTNNVLAIHGLNTSASDADFLLRAELLSVAATGLPDRFFQPPSPGAANDAGYLGLVADTKFSVNRGFYEAPFSLSITCATAGAEIRFTTNGSPPSPTNGSVFSAPIPITGQSMVRAAAFYPNFIPSDVDTHTYLFLRDVLRQSNNLAGYPATWQAGYPADYELDTNLVTHPFYGGTLSNDLRSLPILSIVTEHDGLWGATRGLYNHATSVHDPDAGQDWERAASVELILPDTAQGTTAFAVNCGLQMQGNASRDNARTPKHSFRLLFNGDYGPTKLSYPWFPGPVAEFDNLVLRAAGFTDGWPTRYSDTGYYTNATTGEVFRGQRYRPESSTFLRDIFVKDSHRDMGWLASRSDWVHLYLNGLYWGIYNPSERLDASYLASHIGGWEADWDVLVGDDSLFIAMPADGTKDDWNVLLSLVNAGITSEPAYQAVAALVDLDSLIDYMLLHIFVEAEDWPHHNFYCVHRRANATNGLPATPWQFLTWDQEISLDRLVRRDRVGVNNPDTPARIYSQLRAWPEFRVRFGDRVQKHFFNGGALASSNNLARFAGRAAVITNALVAESARWGDAREFTIGANPGTGLTFTRDEWWVPELHRLWTNFFPTLNETCLARLRAGSLYPALAAPEFSQFGGTVPAGFALTISHTNLSGTVYFTTDGSDPREYGTGAVGPGAAPCTGPVVIHATTLVRARVLSGGVWSALVEAPFYPPQDLSGLAVTEVMYNPLPFASVPGEEFEFLELKNTGTNTLDLSGLTFTAGITGTFTNGSRLAPGGFVVLARNAGMFAARYPGVPLAGLFTGKLDNAGENVTLSYPGGGALFTLAYSDGAPWPATPDGFGFSLVPKQPGVSQAPDDGAKWRASATAGGSPGADDPPPALAASIVINEVLTHTDAPQVDAIELFNPGPTGVDLGGWFLSDDRTQPKKFRIPNGTLLANGGFQVFTAAQFGMGGNTFGLSELGEQVYLFAADLAGNLTGYSHGFDFGAADNGYSFGRHVISTGEEQFPAQASVSLPGTNAGPRVGPVVINEIHYHPATGGVEFVELVNLTAEPVPLFDPAFPTNLWRLDGLSFSFPPGSTISSHALILVVATNPAAFRTQYAVPAEVPIYGPFTGALQNSGELLRLQHPGLPQTNGVVPMIATDEVRYQDQAPWPGAADGTGPSLQRIMAGAYGNEPANWFAATPSPGRVNPQPDSDADGIPDAWEMAYGTDPYSPDANDDPDGDRLTNGAEYVAGTDPHDPGSVLKLEPYRTPEDTLDLSFNTAANRYHRLQSRHSLDEGSWNTITNLPASPQAGRVTVNVPLPQSGVPRSFRLEAGFPSD
jgi:hypothetical protein